MKMIRCGDLYKTETMGDVVIVREAYHWDATNTVTVVPAGKAYRQQAIKISTINRVGYMLPTIRYIEPHHPATISVYDLDHIIGSLSDDEYAELMYAYSWIVDPILQEANELPRCFADVWKTATPKYTPQNVPKYTPPVETRQKKSDSGSTINNGNKVYPESMFSTNELNQYARSFIIDDVYFNGGIQKRSTSILTSDDIDVIAQYMSKSCYPTVEEYYQRMTVFDARLLAIWMPSEKLMKLTGLPWDEARGLKRLCNFLNKMDEDEYNRRFKERNKDLTQEVEVKSDVEESKPYTRQDMKSVLDNVKAYLNQQRLDKIPAELIPDFMSLPKHVVKAAYTGKQFYDNYEKACEKYRNILNIKSEVQ